MMTLRLTITAAAIGVLLTGCSTPQSLVDKISTIKDQTAPVDRSLPEKGLAVDAKTPGTADAAESAAKHAANRPVARRASRPWHGARTVDVQSEEALPPIFTEQFRLSFDDRANQGRVSIGVIAERLMRLTHIPVRVKADVYASGQASAGQAAPAAPAQTTLPPVPMPLPFPLPSTGVPGYPATPLNVPGQAPAQMPPTMPGTGGAPTAAAPGAPSQAPAPTPVPATQAPTYSQPITDISSVEMRWEGTLQGFLDHVTARLNLSWAYRDGVVVIERYLTETFELAAFAGVQDYKMGLTGGIQGKAGAEGTSGSSSSSLDLTESGKIAALDSLKRAVETMVKPTGGSVVLNEGTGRLLVTTTRDIMSRVRDVVKSEDAALQRQAQIQIDVYSVIMNDADERGVDWSLVYQSLSKAWGAALRSPTTLTGSAAGATSINILSGAQGSDMSARFGGSQAVLNLLNQVGESVQHRPLSLIAMNRAWARKTNLKVDGYVSETTPATASSAGSGAPGLKTSSITTGDKFMVQPAILDNGAIILKFGVSLTELLGLFDVTAGSGATLQKVQTPVTSGTDDQGTVRLRPGEAMVVTGLSRRLGTTDRRLLAEGAPVGFGGSRKASVKREEFLIVVRAFEI